MKYIKYSKGDRIGRIVLARPEKRNALNFEVVDELIAVFNQAAIDPEVKVLILEGEGKAFCAGADLAYLKQLQTNSFEENLADSNHLASLFKTIYTLNKVVIAKVDGYAIAGGCGLATVCDYAVTTTESKFGYTEVKIGFVPAIVMIFLLRKIGESKSKELLLKGDLITAEQAQELGLVNEVVEKENIDKRVDELANHLIKTNSEQSMALTKQMIAAIQSEGLTSALEYSADKNARARAFEDCKRGINLFLNKEKIEW